jgi:hypothetical protein
VTSGPAGSTLQTADQAATMRDTTIKAWNDIQKHLADLGYFSAWGYTPTTYSALTDRATYAAALGAPVFAKGHLRRYAILLGIPEDDILGGYERSTARPEQPTLVPKSRAEMAPVRGKSKWPFVLGGAIAFLLAAGLAAYISANGLQLPWPKSAKSQAAAESTDSATATTPSATNPADGAAAATPAAGDIAATPAAVVPAGQVRLQLRFAADSWVEIYDGTGKAVLYDLGKSGTVRTVAAVAPLSVTIGNAAAVSVEVNGRTVRPPPQAPGQTVARFGVGPDGALR